MIGWLNGQRIDSWQQGQKQGVVLACSGVGYEIQLLPRYLNLICSVEELTLWIHQVKREDSETLYGFQTKKERDFFRLLIGVNGVGPQLAISLLEEVQIDELLIAISNEDYGTLSRAQGVGKRTAERISIELRHKAFSFNGDSNDISPIEAKLIPDIPLNSSSIYELEATLKSLGYEDKEIRRALTEVSNKLPSENNQDKSLSQPNIEVIEGLLKECLLWLSNESK